MFPKYYLKTTSIYLALFLVSLFIGWYFSFRSFSYFEIPLSPGDSFFNLRLIKTVAENPWVYYTDRLGWPFGSEIFDYPIPDSGSLLIQKILVLLIGSSWITLNIYFLLGFPVVAISSFWVLRQFAIPTALAFAGAIIYTNLPFHYDRYAHLFYTWYFAAPLFTWYGWMIFSKSPPLFFESQATWYSRLLQAIPLIILSCFGVYYTFFGMLILFVSGSMGTVKYQCYKPLLSAMIAIAIMGATIIINVSPTLIYRATHTENAEAAKRVFFESELYGLKIASLLLPHPAHPYIRFRNMTNLYNTNAPLVTENASASLGLIGSIGFASLVTIITLNLARKKKFMAIHFLARQTIFMTLFCTIGGFSSLFALLVMSQIRAWNRISVFIAFSCITSILILVTHFISKLPRHRMIATGAVALVLVYFALWDQTRQPCEPCLANGAETFKTNAKFVSDIEKNVAPGSGIYQLPYMRFPEALPVNQLNDYVLLNGYLHSSQLKWSYGGIKGREGDLFFRHLAQESIAKQLEVIKKLGFAGIYIDRRGYADQGKQIEEELTQLIGPPLINSDDGFLSFYKLTYSTKPPLFKPGTSYKEIMQRSGYSGD